MLLLSLAIFYTIPLDCASGFFVFEGGVKVALLGCRRLGGPPRLTAGRLSETGRKAGLAEDRSMAIPSSDLTAKPEDCTRGNCRRSDVCGHGIFEAGTLDSMKKQGAGLAPCFSVF